MPHRTACKAVTLDRTGKALALGNACDVNELTRLEDIDADLVADFIFRRSRKAHFANEFDRLNPGFFKTALQWFRKMLFLDFTEAELNRVVAVALGRLVLDHDVVSGFDDRHRNDLSFLGENLRHTEFST